MFPVTAYLKGLGLFDVSPTDERFIFLRPQTVGPQDELVINPGFFEELKRLVPNN